MAATIQGLNLTKLYPIGDERFHALNDVFLEILPGEMVAILGGSGSGKSSLLHVLGCLQRPDSGTLLIEGTDVTQLEDRELLRLRVQKLGLLFQAFNILTNETVVTNVEIPLRRQGMRFAEYRERAEEALELVGLRDRLEDSPSQLTAMERERVGIARVLAQRPTVIFVDELAASLDSPFREELMGLLQKINDDGRTLIISTPEAEVAGYCRRVVRIEEGRTVDEGLVSERNVVSSPGVLTRPSDGGERRDENVCPRCNHGNPKDAETCQRCKFPVHLTAEEQQSIEGRLSGESHWQAVESASDEGDVPGQDLVDELKKVPFFSDMGSKSLVKVIPALEQQGFPGGATIIKQGEEGDSFYIIRSGNVEVVLEGEGGSSTPIAQLGPGEGFGEMALLRDEPRYASVTATTDLETWRLPKAAFQGLLSQNLSLAVYFHRIVDQRLQVLGEKRAL